MTKFYTFLLGASLCVALVSCEKEEKEKQTLKEGINELISVVMTDYYLWNDKIPAITPDESTDPKEYFYSLLYVDDKWSYITDDKEKFLEEEINKTGETFGYDLSFGRFQNSDAVFAVINYVYPGSPAARAGFARGDFILQVDGETLTENNYMSTYETGTRRLLTGAFVDGGISTGREITISSVKMDQNPVLESTIVTRGTSKIGYLMYVGFVDNFRQQLVDALTTFKNAGITDLVLDLRYNPGGEVSTATLLCSAIVPPASMKQDNILIKHIWNASFQSYLDAIAKEQPLFQSSLATFFTEVDCNLNLPGKRVYVLTSRSSASASELLVVGLEPYMEVVQVGDSTRGKYTAMMEFSSTEPELANWMLLPVVYKFANRDGKTDFKNGLPPDYLLKETLPFGALGTTADPLFAKAIELITGEEIPASRDSQGDIPGLSRPSRPYRNALEGQLIHRLSLPE
jgi:C-terminal processing protease CtpA/Prc